MKLYVYKKSTTRDIKNYMESKVRSEYPSVVVINKDLILDLVVNAALGAAEYGRVSVDFQWITYKQRYKIELIMEVCADFAYSEGAKIIGDKKVNSPVLKLAGLELDPYILLDDALAEAQCEFNIPVHEFTDQVIEEVNRRM